MLATTLTAVRSAVTVRARARTGRRPPHTLPGSTEPCFGGRPKKYLALGSLVMRRESRVVARVARRRVAGKEERPGTQRAPERTATSTWRRAGPLTCWWVR